MIKQLGRFIFIAGLLFGAMSIASACDAMGKGKHAGDIVSVDKDSQTFTIKDAQSGKDITFHAAPHVLAILSVNKRVVVSYVEEDGQMKTVDVKAL